MTQTIQGENGDWQIVHDCPKCQDTGFIPTRTIHRNGSVYELTSHCDDCERGMLILKGKMAEPDEERKRSDRFSRNRRLPDAPPAQGSAWARPAPAGSTIEAKARVQGLVAEAKRSEGHRERLVQQTKQRIERDYGVPWDGEVPF